MNTEIYDARNAGGNTCNGRRMGFSPVFLLLAVLFCVCLIIANLMEIKTVNLGPFVITAGVTVFPVSYIISDCLVEIYGFSRARFVIWMGFAMNLLAVIMMHIGLWLPGDANWHGQEAMQLIFGATPRILFASFTAFLVGSMVNAQVMSVMHARHGDRGFSLRAIVSTILGEGSDSLIFFPLAFGGVVPWPMVLAMIVTQTLLKTAYEILVLPVTLRLVRYLRRREAAYRPSALPANHSWWRIFDL